MDRQILDAKMSDIWNRHGVFFAFSAEQFNAKAIAGIKYASCGGGMICPEKNVEVMMNEIDQAIDEHTAQVLEKYGRQRVIWYELDNHEATYTRDIDDAVEALKEYGITREEVIAEWPAYWRSYVEREEENA